MSVRTGGKVCPASDDRGTDSLPTQEEPIITKEGHLFDVETNTALWTVLLAPFSGLKSQLPAITGAQLSLEHIITEELDWGLVNSWMQDANVPVGPRSHIIVLCKRVRAEWVVAVDEGSRPETPTEQWLQATAAVAPKTDRKPTNLTEAIKSIHWSSAEYIPFVNVFYDFFFDEAPTVETMKETLNLIGVMGALIFTVVIAIPLSFDYETYEAMVERWKIGGVYGNCWVDGYFEMEYFVLVTSISIAFAFTTVVLVIFVYVILANTRMDTLAARTAWWRWVRWLYAMIIGVLIGSCITSFMALGNLTEWNVPNRSVIDSPSNACSKSLISSSNNIWGQRSIATTAICGGFCVVAGLIVSMALREKAFVNRVA